VCAAALVVETIGTYDAVGVHGMTSVDDELFVLLDRQDDKQVAVYSINDYQLLRHIILPGYNPPLHHDITSCVRHKCLYMSDWDNSCILRYELASSATSKWSVPAKPFCLSVTPSGNLLVTCREPNKVVELSADSGQSVREIQLAHLSGIADPEHSVQLTNGQFVICHGKTNLFAGGSLHRVCLVGDDGKVTRSYGGERGRDVGQLEYPCHLAVDKDSQFIFVADHTNGRVVLLSPTLEFVRLVIERHYCPLRLYFHQATRRLFVSKQYGREVTVIQL